MIQSPMAEPVPRFPPFRALTGSQARDQDDERWSALENGFRIDVSNIEQLPLRLRA